MQESRDYCSYEHGIQWEITVAKKLQEGTVQPMNRWLRKFWQRTGGLNSSFTYLIVSMTSSFGWLISIWNITCLKMNFSGPTKSISRCLLILANASLIFAGVKTAKLGVCESSFAHVLYSNYRQNFLDSTLEWIRIPSLLMISPHHCLVQATIFHLLHGDSHQPFSDSLSPFSLFFI